MARLDIEMTLRRPAVAGQFYPAEAEALAAEVESRLGDVDADDLPAAPATALPKAVIAPHAGYLYSGPIAGTAYAPFLGRGAGIRRVVLLGPSHRVAFRGLAVSGAHGFATPLGVVPVDRAAVTRALALPGVTLNEAAHAHEHGLEVQLPFLQRLFPNFSLVPIVVGDADGTSVARLLEALWGGPETLIVISSDLSHYCDYTRARHLDAAAARAIETLRPEELSEAQACGQRPILGLLERARALDLRATTTDLRNSGDTAGPRDRVVGYGAWLFEESGHARLSDAHRARLVAAARDAIRHGMRRGTAPAIDTEDLPGPLRATRASFVTLTLDGALRGCIGSPAPNAPLLADVAANARKAAFADPRFAPVDDAAAAQLEIGISILGTPRDIPAADEDTLRASLRPGRDGLILEADGRRALFLPQVWDHLHDPGVFLAALKDKAGLDPGRPLGAFRAQRFSVESF